MVISSDFLERMPPGGSNFGGHYNKEAFNAAVYPKPGARRMERQEHKNVAMHQGAKHNSAVFFTMAKEAQKPSRLRTNVDLHVQKQAAAGKSLWASVEEKVAAQEKERLESGESEAPQVPAAPEGRGGINSQYYPHPVHARGVLKLTRPRALDWGYDPGSLPAKECPFWDAPRHRFEAVANMPGAKPVTPTRSLRWRTAEDWDNAEMHAPLKITHTLPKTNSMVELTRVRRSPID